ncbi:MAG: hypothetical protein JSV05_04935 [Candidatus Bathyarchaeota archaeon]|nr:MAG: hypothetical protein JSV05_04935 [Candidatus Bathyarchaeota archaeon]
MGLVLLPEFFAFLSVDIFVALSLLTCLLDEHFPKALPYIFQAAALGGYVHILISREFLTIFGGDMRFWYCFIYLSVALATAIGLCLYLAVYKKQWTIAKLFSGAVVFPMLFVSGFFAFNYAGEIASTFVLQIAMLFSAIVLGVSISVLLSPQIVRKYWKRR